MSYQCPRCGDPVKRGTSTTAGIAGGAIGALLYSAFGAFQCKSCGPVPRSEFPPHVRRQMALGSVAIVLAAIVILVAAIALLIWIQRW